MEVQCFNETENKKRICTIRGKLRKRVWMHPGDIILVSLREFGDDKGDIIHKYFPEEAHELQGMGEIPESAMIGEGDPDGEEGDMMDIGDDGDDDGEGQKEKLDDDDINDI